MLESSQYLINNEDITQIFSRELCVRANVKIECITIYDNDIINVYKEKYGIILMMTNK